MTRSPIDDLVHRYADAVVHRDEAVWADTWAADGSWDLAGTEVTGRAAIVDMWNAAMNGFAAVVQNVTNGTYELDDRAGTGTGRWFVIEHWARTDGGRGMLLAHYDDRYVRVDDQWCFAARRLVMHYAGPPDLSAPFLNAWADPPSGPS
ncbi:MAG: nuclear transport factor 2 family protein [Actinomycetota bacterium]